MRKKKKTGKSFNVSKCNLVFFFYLSLRLCFSVVYLKSKTSFRWKNLYVPEYFLNNFSFKVKSYSHSKTLGKITITKRKSKRSILMIRELLSFDYCTRFNCTTEKQVNLKRRNVLHAWRIYRFYIKLVQYRFLLTLA